MYVMDICKFYLEKPTGFILLAHDAQDDCRHLIRDTSAMVFPSCQERLVNLDRLAQATETNIIVRGYDLCDFSA